MNRTDFRKITSRILRHSGFITKMNKQTGEYELFDNSSPNPVLYCKPILMTSDTDEAEIENYLCFRVNTALSENNEKIYNRMINRFTRLAPSINISFENEEDPVFTDDEYEILSQIVEEHDTKGESHEE